MRPVNMHAEIELFGGPQDGCQITIPAGTNGEPLSPLPVPSPTYDLETWEPVDSAVAWYEREHRREQGIWVYRYTNTHCAHPSEVG
jgi:hypothetical protein